MLVRCVGRAEKKKEGEAIFHIYTVTMFVKHQEIGCNEFMHEFVTFDMHTHKKVQVYQSVQSNLGHWFENVTALDIIQTVFIIIRNLALRSFF